MRLTPLAESLPASIPFVGPEAQERARGAAFAARLGANESVFGPSPSAVEAMREAAAEAWMYGDPEYDTLRRALAAHHDVPAANVVAGEGIDGLLGYLVRLLVAPGDAVVTSAGAYPTFAYHVTGHGGVLHAVPFAGDHEDPEALLATAAEVGAKLIYLSNPDNPMGSWHGPQVISDMIARVPDGCLLCLDEAYADLAPEGVIPPLDVHDPRVIRMRTFSKAHGLAGMRIGYALGSADLIRAFDKVRLHFGLGRVAQAGAVAALADTAWLAQVQARVVAVPRRHRRHRRAERPHAPALGHELRRRRLRSGRGFRARCPRRTACGGGLRADAGGGPARPLHPHRLRSGGRHGRPARRPATGAGRGAKMTSPVGGMR